MLHTAFYLFVTYAFLRYMFFDRIVTLDELLRGGAVHVPAWGFATFYSAIQAALSGSSWAIAPDARGPGSSCCSCPSRR